jgi:N-acetylglucosaminyldiphosphoundecaprenol N-acetyl-beta-D-mannosaminyltransferase
VNSRSIQRGLERTAAVEPALRLTAIMGMRLSLASKTEIVSVLTRSLLTPCQVPIVIFTANVDHVTRLAQNTDFQQSYRAADFATIDGMPLYWSLKFLGLQPSERVAGVDLCEALLHVAAQHNLRCFLLGSTTETLAAATKQLLAKFPGLGIVGTHHGYFSESQSLFQELARCNPDILLVGMGSPLQERWIAENMPHITAKIILTVGGAFEVFAGRVSRAPRVLQNLSLEWLWRLGHEPKRLWRRYLLQGPRFLYVLARQWRKSRSLGTQGARIA